MLTATWYNCSQQPSLEAASTVDTALETGATPSLQLQHPQLRSSSAPPRVASLVTDPLCHSRRQPRQDRETAPSFCMHRWNKMDVAKRVVI